MVKLGIIFYFLFILSSFAFDFKLANISGNTTYTQQGDSKSFTSVFVIERRFLLFEHPQKKYNVSIGGKVTFDVNHFGGTIKNNVFTTLGIDFW